MERLVAWKTSWKKKPRRKRERERERVSDILEDDIRGRWVEFEVKCAVVAPPCPPNLWISSIFNLSAIFLRNSLFGSGDVPRCLSSGATQKFTPPPPPKERAWAITTNGARLHQ